MIALIFASTFALGQGARADRAIIARYAEMKKGLQRVTGWSVRDAYDVNFPRGAFHYFPPSFLPPCRSDALARFFSLHHEAVHGMHWARVLSAYSSRNAALTCWVTAPDDLTANLPEGHRNQFITNEFVACRRSASLARSLERRGWPLPYQDGEAYAQCAQKFAAVADQAMRALGEGASDASRTFEWRTWLCEQNGDLVWVRVRLKDAAGVKFEFVTLIPRPVVQCEDLLRSRLTDLAAQWIAIRAIQGP